MKRVIAQIVLLTVALLTASCGKDYLSDELKTAATTKISVKSEDGRVTKETVPFDRGRVTVYRKSEYDDQSWLSAWSGGKMSYNTFFLSIYFPDIEKMKVGDILKPSHVRFSLPASSDSRDYTEEYSGKITLANKGNDYVILEFHKVVFSIGKGDYTIDGSLYCKLEDKLELDYYDLLH